MRPELRQLAELLARRALDELRARRAQEAQRTEAAPKLPPARPAA